MLLLKKYKIEADSFELALVIWRASLVAQMVMKSACNAREPGLVPGSGRSPGEGNGYPLQYSCLENSMDKGAWQAIIYGFTETQTQLSD